MFYCNIVHLVLILFLSLTNTRFLAFIFAWFFVLSVVTIVLGTLNFAGTARLISPHFTMFIVVDRQARTGVGAALVGSGILHHVARAFGAAR